MAEETNNNQNTGEEMNAAPAAKVAKKGSSGITYAIGTVVILALLGAGAWWYFAGGGQEMLQNNSEGDMPMEDSEYPDVVARVNGEDVSGEEYADSVAQMEAQAAQQGADPDDPTVREQINEQAMTILINTVLLRQATADAGITASSTQVDAQVAAVGDSMTRAEVESQLAIQTYLDEAIGGTNISVSEEEIASFYADLEGQGQELPPLADVSAQIEQQLLAQKQREAVLGLIDELRAEANIEILI